jgi:pimeloyl-ACP methyl ester carboxylesterase
MTSQAIAGVRPVDRIERYRRTERAVWDHYGMHPAERFVDVDEPAARIRVVEAGSGPPLLVAHGTFGNAPGSAALLREMPTQRWLLMDRPGFGLSSPIRYRAASFGTVIADLQRQVLDGLALERVDVVGASIGTVFALRLAQHHPDRVRRVILLGAGPIVQEAGVPTPIRLIASPLGGLMVRAMRRRRMVESMIRGSGHGPALDDGRIPPVVIDWRAAVNRETDSMRHERAMVRAIVDGARYRPGVTFSEEELAAIKHPTLLVQGTADSVGSPALWQRVIGGMPSGKLSIMDGAGHMPWLDDPAGVARRVEAFLR